MFRKYMHIERLGNSRVEGILDGMCYIFPKLDGANASIWLEYGTLHTGSRNREIDIDNDNAGFATWVVENAAIFMPFFVKYPHLRLYGEWLVPHTLKNYILDAWHNFYVFDVFDDLKNVYIAYEDYVPLLSAYQGIKYIERMAYGFKPDIETIAGYAMSNTYLTSTGIGEGVVIKNYSFTSHGEHVWGKYVVEQFKEERKVSVTTESDEEKLALRFVTPGRIAKIAANMQLSGPLDKSRIRELLWRVWGDFIQEEIVSIAMSRKYTIDFSKLYNFTVAQVKIAIPELFE